MRFRKKPVVVEAEQWWPGTILEGVEEYSNVPVESIDQGIVHPAAFIQTLEGPMMVTPGDWIIIGVKGRYACKPDIFILTYEPMP